MRLFTTLAVVASGLLFSAGPTVAEETSGFYKGKTVSIVVGFGPGGGYDLYARTLARHLGKHIPGQPNVIVQNMEGAGSIRAANYVYAAAPKDGTVIATVVQDIPLFQLLGNAGVQYDATRFHWLGGIVSSNSTLYTWHSSGIRSWEDAKAREVVLGSTGITSSMVARTMNNWFKGTWAHQTLIWPCNVAKSWVRVERPGQDL
jgi:tripartite-type tricarboxylate transporter receptor subunit TctC